MSPNEALMRHFLSLWSTRDAAGMAEVSKVYDDGGREPCLPTE